MEKIQVNSVTATRLAGFLAIFLICSTITPIIPVPSIMPPNIIAMMVREMEKSMDSIPPRSSRPSTASRPVEASRE